MKIHEAVSYTHLDVYKRQGEELVKGQATSAPSNFRPLRVIGRTTLVATVLFALFYANYLKGWVSIEDIAPFKMPASLADSSN